MPPQGARGVGYMGIMGYMGYRIMSRQCFERLCFEMEAACSTICKQSLSKHSPAQVGRYGRRAVERFVERCYQDSPRLGVHPPTLHFRPVLVSPKLHPGNETKLAIPERLLSVYLWNACVCKSRMCLESRMNTQNYQLGCLSLV